MISVVATPISVQYITISSCLRYVQLHLGLTFYGILTIYYYYKPKVFGPRRRNRHLQLQSLKRGLIRVRETINPGGGGGFTLRVRRVVRSIRRRALLLDADAWDGTFALAVYYG